MVPLKLATLHINLSLMNQYEKLLTKIGHILSTYVPTLQNSFELNLKSGFIDDSHIFGQTNTL